MIQVVHPSPSFPLSIAFTFDGYRLPPEASNRSFPVPPFPFHLPMSLRPSFPTFFTPLTHLPLSHLHQHPLLSQGHHHPHSLIPRKSLQMPSCPTFLRSHHLHMYSTLKKKKKCSKETPLRRNSRHSARLTRVSYPAPYLLPLRRRQSTSTPSSNARRKRKSCSGTISSRRSRMWIWFDTRQGLFRSLKATISLCINTRRPLQLFNL